MKSAGPSRQSRPSATILAALCGGAAVFVVAALWLPVWRMKLEAPQYPNGLQLVAYGDRIEGDLAEDVDGDDDAGQMEAGVADVGQDQRVSGTAEPNRPRCGRCHVVKRPTTDTAIRRRRTPRRRPSPPIRWLLRW